RRRVPAFALCEERRYGGRRRRRFRQQRPPVRRAEAEERTAGAANHPQPAAPAAVADRGHLDLYLAGAESAPRRPLLAQPVSVRTAGGRPECLVFVGPEDGRRNGP